jgi:hypothetical protein
MRDNLARNHTRTIMKITLNIETNDPADLERVAAALAGKDVAVTTSGKPATAARTTKTETAAAPSGGAAQASQAAQADQGQAASTAASVSEAAVPSDADLIAAANAATGKVGVGGPDKVKTYIAANFKKADGSPGTLKTTAEGERAKLLLALQQIGRGEITL